MRLRRHESSPDTITPVSRQTSIAFTSVPARIAHRTYGQVDNDQYDKYTRLDAGDTRLTAHDARLTIGVGRPYAHDRKAQHTVLRAPFDVGHGCGAQLAGFDVPATDIQPRLTRTRV